MKQVTIFFLSTTIKKPCERFASLRDLVVILVVVIFFFVIIANFCFVFDFKVDLMCFFEELFEFPFSFAVKPKDVFMILEQ